MENGITNQGLNYSCSKQTFMSWVEAKITENQMAKVNAHFKGERKTWCLKETENIPPYSEP